MFRATNCLIFRSTFWLIYNIGPLYQSCIYSQHVLLKMGEFSSETCRKNLNTSIRISISGNCCILSIAYTIVQQIHIDKIRMFYHILRFITYLFRSLLRPLSACFTRILIKCNYSINKTTYAIWAIVAFYRCSWWWSLNRPNQVGED